MQSTNSEYGSLYLVVCHVTFTLETQRAETALLLTFWVPLAAGPVAEQKQNETKDYPPGPPPGKGVVQSPSPDEQSPPSLGRPSQGLLHLDH